MSPNEVLDEQREYERYVTIGNYNYPVTNSLCPKCDHGWEASFDPKFSWYEYKVYHKSCLKKKLKNKFDKKVANGEIYTE